MGHPNCLGFYAAGHHECDGNPDGTTFVAKSACAWRDRCAGFQAFCQETNHKAPKVLETLNDESLSKLCERQIERLGIEEGKVTATTKEEKPSSAPTKKEPLKSNEMEALEEKLKEARQASKRAAVNPKRQRRKARTTSEKPHTPVDPTIAKIADAVASPQAVPEASKRPQNPRTVRSTTEDRPQTKRHQNPRLPAEVVELTMHFEQCLRDTFTEYNFANRSRVVANPGTFYSVDRLKGCSYIRWYCSSKRGRDVAVARIRVKTRNRNVDVDIPVSLEALLKRVDKEICSIINPIARKDGQFQTVCRGLDKAGVSELIQILSQMVKIGAFSLPKGQQ